jgi:hypothetical protein
VGRPVTVVDLFQFSTVRALAAHLDPAPDEAEAAGPGTEPAETGQDRVTMRRAMMRRAGGRPSPRPRTSLTPGLKNAETRRWQREQRKNVDAFHFLRYSPRLRVRPFFCRTRQLSSRR